MTCDFFDLVILDCHHLEMYNFIRFEIQLFSTVRGCVSLVNKCSAWNKTEKRKQKLVKLHKMSLRAGKCLKLWRIVYLERKCKSDQKRNRGKFWKMTESLKILVRMEFLYMIFSSDVAHCPRFFRPIVIAFNRFLMAVKLLAKSDVIERLLISRIEQSRLTRSSILVKWRRSFFDNNRSVIFSISPFMSFMSININDCSGNSIPPFSWIHRLKSSRWRNRCLQNQDLRLFNKN